MPKSPGQERRARARPLYHAAKISDARFRKVLMHFAQDDTVAETALKTGLSQTAINALFLKLRRFFVEAGMFTDIYEGGDPRDGLPGDPDLEEIRFEQELIGFHIARVRAKRGTSKGEYEPDHFAESHWRFHYLMLGAIVAATPFTT